MDKKVYMIKALLIALVCLFIYGCHVPPGQVNKHTGYNPASGKVKVKSGSVDIKVK